MDVVHIAKNVIARSAANPSNDIPKVGSLIESITTMCTGRSIAPRTVKSCVTQQKSAGGAISAHLGKEHANSTASIASKNEQDGSAIESRLRTSLPHTASELRMIGAYTTSVIAPRRETTTEIKVVRGAAKTSIVLGLSHNEGAPGDAATADRIQQPNGGRFAGSMTIAACAVESESQTLVLLLITLFLSTRAVQTTSRTFNLFVVSATAVKEQLSSIIDRKTQ